MTGICLILACVPFAVFPLPLPGMTWKWVIVVGDSHHRFEHNCYFRAKSLAKHQASVVFWVISGCGRFSSSGTQFTALTVIGALLTRAGLLATSFLSFNLGRRKDDGAGVVKKVGEGNFGIKMEIHRKRANYISMFIVGRR